MIETQDQGAVDLTVLKQKAKLQEFISEIEKIGYKNLTNENLELLHKTLIEPNFRKEISDFIFAYVSAIKDVNQLENETQQKLMDEYFELSARLMQALVEDPTFAEKFSKFIDLSNKFQMFITMLNNPDAMKAMQGNM